MKTIQEATRLYEACQELAETPVDDKNAQWKRRDEGKGVDDKFQRRPFDGPVADVCKSISEALKALNACDLPWGEIKDLERKCLEYLGDWDILVYGAWRAGAKDFDDNSLPTWRTP